MIPKDEIRYDPSEHNKEPEVVTVSCPIHNGEGGAPALEARIAAIEDRIAALEARQSEASASCMCDPNRYVDTGITVAEWAEIWGQHHRVP